MLSALGKHKSAELKIPYDPMTRGVRLIVEFRSIPEKDQVCGVLEVLTFLATSAIAVLAIWGDWIRHRITPPRLEVRLRREATQVEVIGDTKTRYWHLDVRNLNGWNPAIGVKVFITRIDRKTANGWDSYEIGRIPLKWQFSCYGMNPDTFGAPWFCDLGRLTEGGYFELATEFVPASCDTTLKKEQTVRVAIEAIGSNARSAVLRLESYWDGEWHDDDDEMSEHLMVKVV